MDQVTPPQPASTIEPESLPEAVETPQAVSLPVPPSAPETVPEAIPETRTADTPSEELAPPAPASGDVQAPEAPSAGSSVSETPPAPAPVLEEGSIPVSEPAEETTPAPAVEPSSVPAPVPPPARAPEPETMAVPSAPQSPPQERIIERVSPPSEADVHALNALQLKALAARAREAKRSKVQNRLDAIVQYLKTKGYIANDEVQKLLRVSDATATRYLRALVKSGIVMKLGRGGRGARYRLAQGDQ